MEKNKNGIKECELCGSNANSLCFKCLSYYCDSCYKYAHDKPKKSNHQKKAIDPYVPIDLKCQEHPEIPLTLFCLDEKGKYKI